LSSASNGEELGVADVGDQRVAPDGLAQLLGDGDAGSVAAGGAGQAEQQRKAVEVDHGDDEVPVVVAAAGADQGGDFLVERIAGQ
jgi:hypothetical protein